MMNTHYLYPLLFDYMSFILSIQYFVIKTRIYEVRVTVRIMELTDL